MLTCIPKVSIGLLRVDISYRAQRPNPGTSKATSDRFASVLTGSVVGLTVCSWVYFAYKTFNGLDTFLLRGSRVFPAVVIL